MLKDTFFREMKGRIIDVGDYMICSKPATIYNYETEEKQTFKNIEDAYENGMLGDMALKEFVDKADINIFHQIVTNDDSDLKII